LGKEYQAGTSDRQKSVEKSIADAKLMFSAGIIRMSFNHMDGFFNKWKTDACVV
jgi:hypothetical protein